MRSVRAAFCVVIASVAPLALLDASGAGCLPNSGGDGGTGNGAQDCMELSIGQGGGTLSTSDGSSVFIPAGALPRVTNVSFCEGLPAGVEPPAVGSANPVAYRLSPLYTQTPFPIPVSIRGHGHLYWSSDGFSAWVPIPSTPDGDYQKTTTTSFGLFWVGPPIPDAGTDAPDATLQDAPSDAPVEGGAGDGAPGDGAVIDAADDGGPTKGDGRLVAVNVALASSSPVFATDEQYLYFQSSQGLVAVVDGEPDGGPADATSGTKVASIAQDLVGLAAANGRVLWIDGTFGQTGTLYALTTSTFGAAPTALGTVKVAAVANSLVTGGPAIWFIDASGNLRRYDTGTGIIDGATYGQPALGGFASVSAVDAGATYFAAGSGAYPIYAVRGAVIPMAASLPTPPDPYSFGGDAYGRGMFVAPVDGGTSVIAVGLATAGGAGLTPAGTLPPTMRVLAPFQTAYGEFAMYSTIAVSGPLAPVSRFTYVAPFDGGALNVIGNYLNAGALPGAIALGARYTYVLEQARGGGFQIEQFFH